MAGRGKPRSQLTFNAELLGVGRGAEPPPPSVLDLPPTYPPLNTKPKLPPAKMENSYMLAVYKDFINRMQDSPYHLSLKPSDAPSSSVYVELYSDRFQGPVRKPMKNVDWRWFPEELAPPSKHSVKSKGTKRKGCAMPNVIARKKDITKRLDKLEANEKTDDADDTVNPEDNEEEKDEGDENSENDEEDVDEEMDDETDYANNYFDNGEGYLDEEEENLDEGGIY